MKFSPTCCQSIFHEGRNNSYWLNHWMVSLKVEYTIRKNAFETVPTFRTRDWLSNHSLYNASKLFYSTQIYSILFYSNLFNSIQFNSVHFNSIQFYSIQFNSTLSYSSSFSTFTGIVKTQIELRFARCVQSNSLTTGWWKNTSKSDQFQAP